MNKKTLIIGSILLLLVGQVAATTQAAWIDDWLDQRTTTTPNYLEGQKRGYISGGGFSARWPSTNTYPVTIEPPRLKGGCGGIDVFLGGMSFMNTEYLVDKLQNILSGAAAVAFDLALKTLCEQCSNTIKNFEALADKLNSMQMEDCAAAKTLVGIVADENGFRSSEEMQKRLDTAIKENKLTQGVSEMWDIITKENKSNDMQPQSGDVSAVVAGCDAEIRSSFLGGGSLLDNIGGKLGVPSDYISLIRGLVGDVRLEGASGSFKVSYESPCSENNPDDINAITTGDVYAMDSSGNCTQISDASRDLRQFILDKMVGIADKIKNKGTLTSSEEDFLAASPLSPLPILKTAVGTNMEETIIANLAELTARAFALQLLSDLYTRADSIAWKAREVLEKDAVPSSGQPSTTCAAEIFADHVDHNIAIMIKRIRRLKASAKSSYIASAQEMNEIMNLMQHMKQIEDEMMTKLSRRYGKWAAYRAMN